MEDLLTARQVQDILKVDRITVYRMLQDGRLKAVKIGQQWRFPRSAIERLISGETPAAPAAGETGSLPVHCIQTIQNLFSDVSQLAAVMVDLQGAPLTEVSQPCRFCTLLQESESGRQACQADWAEFSRRSQQGETTFTCHAGLNYIGARIFDNGEQVGLFLLGCFRWQPHTPEELGTLTRALAFTHQLSPQAVEEAVRQVPVLAPARRVELEGWSQAVASAIHSILKERTGFLNRLQQIAHLTQVS